MKKIVLIFLLLVFCGCASSNKFWFHGTKKVGERDRDLKECEYEATKNTPAYATSVGGAYLLGERYNEIVRQCMELKGYVLIEEESLRKKIRDRREKKQQVGLDVSAYLKPKP